MHAVSFILLERGGGEGAGGRTELFSQARIKFSKGETDEVVSQQVLFRLLLLFKCRLFFARRSKRVQEVGGVEHYRSV